MSQTKELTRDQLSELVLPSFLPALEMLGGKPSLSIIPRNFIKEEYYNIWDQHCGSPHPTTARSPLKVHSSGKSGKIEAIRTIPPWRQRAAMRSEDRADNSAAKVSGKKIESKPRTASVLEREALQTADRLNLELRGMNTGVKAYPMEMPISLKTPGILFFGKPLVVVAAKFGGNTSVYEIIRNPESSVSVECFSAENFISSISHSMGIPATKTILGKNEFLHIKSVGHSLGLDLRRSEFSFVPGPNILILPENACPLLAASLHKNISLAVLQGRELVDGVEYDKIDIFVKHTEISRLEKSIARAIYDCSRNFAAPSCDQSSPLAG